MQCPERSEIGKRNPKWRYGEVPLSGVLAGL